MDNKQAIEANEQKQISNCTIQQNQIQPTKQQSEYFQKYKQFMTVDHIDEHPILQVPSRYIETIDFNLSQFENMPVISFKSYTSNYEAVRLQIKFGYISMEMNILNVKGISCIHQAKKIASTFAQIYFVMSQFGKVAVKCFRFKTENYQKMLFSAIKQYFFLKNSSYNLIGPIPIRPFGFDIIIYHNCIEFAMQYCHHSTNLTNIQKNELKSKLEILHKMHIVHMDIKPDNIAYSSILKSHVFIDFGLSKPIREDIGYKTLIKFSGSINFCSPQMLKLVHGYNEDEVDVYYNDAHCLNESFLLMQRQTNNYHQQFVQQEGLFIQNQQIQFNITKGMMKMEIKYLFFCSICIFQIPSYQQMFLMNYQEMLDFIQLLPYSKFIQDVQSYTLRHIPQNKKQNKFKSHFQSQKYQVLFKFIPSLQAQVNSDVQTFQSRINWLQFIQKQFFSAFDDKPLDNKWILDRKIVLEIQQRHYFREFIYFVNLTNNKSTFQEKCLAAQLLIGRMNLSLRVNSDSVVLNKQQLQTKQFQVIIICLNFLKTYFLRNSHRQIEVILPIILINLIIFQAIQVIQIQQYFKDVNKLNLSITQQAQLLFRSFLGILSIQYRAFSKYKSLKLIKMVYSLVYPQLIKLKQQTLKQKYKFSNVIVEMIILLFQIHNKNYKIEKYYQLFTINLFRQRYAINEECIINQLILFWLVLLAQKCAQECNQEYLLIVLQKISVVQGYFQKFGHFKFHYFHFHLLNTLYSTNIPIPASNIYQRFQKCVQHQTLLKKYRIYYFNHNKHNILTNPQHFIKNSELILLHMQTIFDHLQLVVVLGNVVTSPFFDGAMQSNSDLLQLKVLIYKLLSFDYLIVLPFPIHDHDNQKNISKFYKFWELIVQIYYCYHIKLKDKQNDILRSIWLFIAKLQQYILDIQCQGCKSDAQSSIFRAKQYIYRYTNQLQQIIKINLSALVQFQKKQLLSAFIMTYLNSALPIFIFSPYLQSKYNGFQTIYNLVQKHNLYGSFLCQKQRTESWMFLYQYLIVRKHNMQKYLQLHVKIAKLLHVCPSKEYIVRYAGQTQKFIRKYKKIAIQTLAFIRSIKFQLNQRTSYLSIFYSLLLQASDGPIQTKLVRIICEDCSQVVNFAKRGILISLFSYQIRLINIKIQTLQAQVKKNDILKLKERSDVENILYLSLKNRLYRKIQARQKWLNKLKVINSATAARNIKMQNKIRDIKSTEIKNVLMQKIMLIDVNYIKGK